MRLSIANHSLVQKCISKSTKLLAIVTILLAMSACSISIDGNNYESQNPDFNLKEFFDGKVTAWGIVQDRSGEVVQRFVVNIDGSIEGDKLILDETFEYGLGEGPSKRIWTLVENPDGSFTGNAGDIAGDATGISYGNAFNFAYEMDLDVDGSTYRVNFDDWFWAFDDNTMMNRSYIKKFGIVMAEVTIFMQKQD
jgi:hypothetical protein